MYIISCVHVPRISLTAEYRYENRKIFENRMFRYRCDFLQSLDDKNLGRHKTYRYI